MVPAIAGDSDTADFSCVSCKMNARMSGQSLKYVEQQVGRDDGGINEMIVVYWGYIDFKRLLIRRLEHEPIKEYREYR